MSLGYRCKCPSGRKAEIPARHDSTLATFTGSRPGAPLAIENRDVDLFISSLRRRNLSCSFDSRIHNHVSSSESRKYYKKEFNLILLTRIEEETSTFNIDVNSALCLVTHIITLGFNDNAFKADRETSPEYIFKLYFKPALGCQPIPRGKK